MIGIPARRALGAFALGSALQAAVGLGCHADSVPDSPLQSDMGVETGHDDAAAPPDDDADGEESAGAHDDANDDGTGGDGTPSDDDHASDDVADDGDSEPVLECSGALTSYEGTGSATMYWFDQGTITPNCSHPILERGKGTDRVAGINTGDGRYFAAINTADYAAAAACGECFEVARDDGRSVIVTVVDQCPISSNDKCIAGHIDLSVAAFLQIGEESEGYLGERAGRGRISLRPVSCPMAETIQLALKEPANANWNQLLVVGHRHPLARVEVQVDGQWALATRESYNYWTPPAGRMGSSPYRVRLTDVHGHSVESDVALNESGFRDTGEQFPDCKP